MIWRPATLVVALAIGSLGAQAPLPYRAAIDAYREALATLEKHRTGRHDLEAAFQAATSVADELKRMVNGTRTVLESLSGDDFRRVQDELPSLLIGRQEALFVEPDPDFFVQLAVGHGDAADRRFFAALKATYPESTWPVYVEQQTDHAGCTRFGDGKLVETYRVWNEFQHRFPTRYAPAARKEVARVTGAFTESTCACGDGSGVERELQQFVREFPRAVAKSKVDERLQAVRAGRSDIRPRCIAG